LSNRGLGGGSYTWSLYTAAVGGGYGVKPNAFEIWEYPNAGASCCKRRFAISPNLPEMGYKAVYISAAGNLGIGKEADNNFTIDVVGNIRNTEGSISSGGDLAIGTTWASNDQGWNRVIDLYGANNSKLLVRSSTVKTGIFSNELWGGTVGRIGTESNHDLRFMVGYGNDVMTLNTSGNVGIGTTNPGAYKLTVEGTIGARKLKITQNTWADVVFKKDYKLMPLTALANYIEQNKHLPEVPTEKQVKGKDLDVAETQTLLLKKIEELTLYVIQLNNENQKLKVEQLKIKKHIKL
jgi:adhesin HecA-like repeat protein